MHVVAMHAWRPRAACQKRAIAVSHYAYVCVCPEARAPVHTGITQSAVKGWCMLEVSCGSASQRSSGSGRASCPSLPPFSSARFQGVQTGTERERWCRTTRLQRLASCTGWGGGSSKSFRGVQRAACLPARPPACCLLPPQVKDVLLQTMWERLER